jgi:hypothetical protein
MVRFTIVNLVESLDLQAPPQPHGGIMTRTEAIAALVSRTGVHVTRHAAEAAVGHAAVYGYYGIDFPSSSRIEIRFDGEFSIS